MKGVNTSTNLPLAFVAYSTMLEQSTLRTFRQLPRMRI